MPSNLSAVEQEPALKPSLVRDHLVRVASDLFYREGIHTVGVERILSEANVTRATLYRHFHGKEGLVVAHLQLEDDTIRRYFEAGAAQATSPRHLVELVIEGIAEDIDRYHDRGCPFINAAAEYPDPTSAVRQVITSHRAWFRTTLESVTRGAKLPRPADAAQSLVLLRDAALVGGYLDGTDLVRPAFVRTARLVSGFETAVGL